MSERISKWANCTVCGDRATRLRYSHYGAVSCFSCRAFFRRAIEKGTVYECRKETGGCGVTVATRKKCAACRFNKCLKVGMTHGKIKRVDDELEDDELAVIDVAYKNVDISDDSEQIDQIMKISTDPSLVSLEFSSEELLRVKTLADADRATRIPFGDALLLHVSDEKGYSWRLVKGLVWAALTGHALEFAAVCWGYTLGIRKLTRFAQAVPEFAALTISDQKALLLHNLDPMFNIRSGFFFQTDDVADFYEQLERFSIFDISRITSCSEWLPFGDLLSSVVTVPAVKWNQFFVTPWANSVEHEKKYEYLVSCLNNLKLDFQSACLLSVVALFSTEGMDKSQLTPTAISVVKKQQQKFCFLLFRYLCHVRGRQEAAKAFPAFVRMLANLREMSEIMKNKTIKICPVPKLEQYMLDITLDINKAEIYGNDIYN